MIIPAALPFAVRAVTPVSGGQVASAARVETADAGTIFVKWTAGDAAVAPPDLYRREADGLECLRAANAFRVPEVLAVGDDLLALEWIAAHPVPQDDPAFVRRFAEGLATLHRTAADAFGLDHDNYLGPFPQQNTPTVARWPDFYRERRLLPQIERARDLGYVDAERERLLMSVVARIEALLDDLDGAPALVHGDLWSGNFMVDAEARPVLIDPAIYFGEREVEIAYIELFGGFPPGLVSAYDAAFPLAPGYARRRPLHQLYPLLVHLNYFGPRYAPAVERACHACR